ncbi:type II secretion system F family protein [Leifsonia sp. LS-T14]|uniref:type II secretion system F family protein n=1 Tax=unclassified Leifsonia TaxID=2663824 RepID=UPI0035A605A2
MMQRPPGAEADAVAALAESLAVLLDAGLPPRSAWAVVAEHGGHPVAARVVASLAAQTSCAAALGEAAQSDDVRALAAAWSVAEVAGTPLGHTLRVVAGALRDVAEAERDGEVALSGPRATARLVAWLPAAGVILAVALGTDVVGAAASPAGATAVGAGVVLMFLGRWWMSALLRRALARRPIPGLAEELIALSLAGGASAAASVEAADRSVRSAGLPALDHRAARRILQVAESAGAPAVELLTASARQVRRTARTDARRAAATLGVRLMLPLGLCVLPSFLLLAVVPLALSLLASTTAGLR